VEDIHTNRRSGHFDRNTGYFESYSGIKWQWTNVIRHE